MFSKNNRRKVQKLMWESGPLGLPNIALVLSCPKLFVHQVSHLYNSCTSLSQNNSSFIYVQHFANLLDLIFKGVWSPSTVAVGICSAPEQAEHLIHIHISELTFLMFTSSVWGLQHTKVPLQQGGCAALRFTEPTKILIAFSLSSDSIGHVINTNFIKITFVYAASCL